MSFTERLQFEKRIIEWKDPVSGNLLRRPAAFIGGSGEFSPMPGYSRFWKPALSAAVEEARGSFEPKQYRENIEIAHLFYSLEELKESFEANQVVKIKIRSIDELRNVQKIHDCFDGKIKFRIDLNGYLDFDEAFELFNKIDNSDLNVEFIEQPLKSIDEMSELNRVVKDKGFDTALAIDESVANMQELVFACQKNSFDLLVLRNQHCGGVEKGIIWAQLCEQYGKTCVVSTLMETEIGVRSGIKLAKAIPNLFGACGLFPYAEAV